MPDNRTIVDVAVGIVWQGERFLAACRPATRPKAGLWEFPGGKITAGESVQAALTRELQEELGVTPLTMQPWKTVEHQYDDIHVRLHFMHVTQFHGCPAPLEGQELRWVTPTEATQLPFLPADKPLLPGLAPPATAMG